MIPIPVKAQSFVRIIALLALLVPLVACKKDQAPAALAPDQVAPALQEAFTEATPEAQKEVQEVVDATKSQDESAAFVELVQLGGRQDLTPEQRTLVTRAVASVGGRLQVAADQGNAQAQKLLDAYRASK